MDVEYVPDIITKDGKTYINLTATQYTIMILIR